MKFTRFPSISAPGFLGAFLLPLGLLACKDQDQTADWAGHPKSGTPRVAAAQATPAPPAASAGAAPVAKADPVAAGTVRFIAYNVENWLTMDRYVDGKSLKGSPKPEKEKMAIAGLLADAKPDILGVSEIGNEEDVKDLQSYLAKVGHPMPHFHLNRGVDPTRSLGLISRFPIGRTVKHDRLTYRSQGRDYAMQRGILDASVETPAGVFRFLGVHLKSKRETDDGDQEDMRLNEAHLLRREIDAILNEDPGSRLVVYGDFNDTRQSPTVRTIHGGGKNPRSLAMIALKDSRGHYWTHHWDFQDVYSRIDYVMVSGALKQSIDWDRCKVIDNDAVAGASDHRPLLVILKQRG
jgi:endonuclease/exonuclease/phosphatase family metal-dependent hydrolase